MATLAGAGAIWQFGFRAARCPDGDARNFLEKETGVMPLGDHLVAAAMVLVVTFTIAVMVAAWC
jgi:hypothetical protein